MYIRILDFLYIYRRYERVYVQAVFITLIRLAWATNRFIACRHVWSLLSNQPITQKTADRRGFACYAVRDLGVALVISFAQRPRVPHQAKEPVSQLMNTIDLAKVQSLLGQQFSTQADSRCPGLNKVKRRQLIHAA